MLDPRCTYIIARRTRGRGQYQMLPGGNANRLDGNHVPSLSWGIKGARSGSFSLVTLSSAERSLSSWLLTVSTASCQTPFDCRQSSANSGKESAAAPGAASGPGGFDNGGAFNSPSSLSRI